MPMAIGLLATKPLTTYSSSLTGAFSGINQWRNRTMAILTRDKYLELFPNSFISQADTLKLSQKDGEAWEENPVCMNYKCRSNKLTLEGQNETYEVDVYVCDDCETVSVQGYKIIRTGGNVGSQEDLDSIGETY